MPYLNLKKKRKTKLLSFILFLIFGFQANSQVFVQIEKFNSIDRFKLQEGDVLKFKTKEHKDTWRSEEIERIMPEENVIVLSGQLYHPEDFHKIRIANSGFKRAVGPLFQSFGLGWFTFGGIAALALDYDFSVADGIIGGVAVLIGTIFRKLFKHEEFRIDKNSRIRIIDLRMLVPENYPLPNKN